MPKPFHPNCPYCSTSHFPLSREGPGYTVPEDATSAVSRLAEALNDFPELRTRALAHVTQQDIMDLLTPAPPRVRGNALRFLGLRLSPRAVSRTLCRDVLQRLGNATPHDAGHFAGILAPPVVSALLHMVADPDGPRPRWSPTVLAAIMWNSLSAGAEGARVLTWAADQHWWPGFEVEEEALTEVLAAATSIIEKTPDFVHRPHLAQEAPNTEQPEGLTAMAVDPRAVETEPTSPEKPGVASEEIRQGRAELDLHRSRAQQAITALNESLTEGARLHENELAALSAYDTGLEAWAHRLSLVPTDIRIADLDAVLERSEEHERANARLLSLLDLTDLSGITATQFAVLRGLIDQAREEQDTPLRAALMDLAELVELSAAEPDLLRMQALQSAIVATLPDELKGLPLAVIMRSQTATQPPVSPTEASSEESTESEDASSDQVFVQESEPYEEPTAPVPGPTVSDTAHHEAPEAEDSTHDPTETVLHRLVAERRFTLATALAEATNAPEQRVAALRMAAFSEHVRGPNGPCAVRLRNDLVDLDPQRLTEDSPSLLLAAPALLRTALITGESTAGALLARLAPHLEGHLAAVAEAVGQRALKGLLAGNPLGAAWADSGQLKARLERARTEAKQRLEAPRNLRFRRATKLAQDWFAEQGKVGALLKVVAEDDRACRAKVTEQLATLTRRENLNKEIDRADAAMRGPSNRVLQGAARNNLVSLVESTLAVVSEWLDAVSALEEGEGRGRVWATEDLTEMRRTVLRHLPQARRALLANSSRGSLVGAAHTAAARALDEIARLFEEGVPTGQAEPLPDHALTTELLKVAHATVDPITGRVSPPEATGPYDLVAAADLDWPEALDVQIRAERYPTARHLVDLSETGVLTPAGAPLPENARSRIDTAERRSRDELTQARDKLLTTLRRARVQQEISEEQDDRLTELLDLTARLDTSDLAPVRARVEEAARILPEYRSQAASRLTKRLDALLARPDRSEVDEGRIRSLIEDGQLLTAEELIYFSEIGEPLPRSDEDQHLTDFFPRVPDGLSRGITAGLVEAARSGGEFSLRGGSGLDFGGLSEDARVLAADALAAWRAARDIPSRQRNQVGRYHLRGFLVPALRLLGYDVPAAAGFHQLRPKGLDRGYFEFSRITWNGNPTVPQFGSKLHGRLRVMVCWGQPRAELLRSWVDKDTAGGPLLVTYLGTMSAEVRRRFAVEAVHNETPVIVVDDAALAYLAAHGDRQVGTALSVLLPFSSVQPYVRKKRSLVPPEMFYGRATERSAVIDAEDTQVVFGGRGLGKSALLDSAKTAFEREPERVALHIELSTVAMGQGVQGADAVWDVLLRELRTQGVVPKPGRRDTGKAYDLVRAGVLSWLTADSRRRLLVMLDESDGFFEADAPRFLETNRLKELGQLPGAQERAKVVFAGLHSVQRYSKVSNNTFKHLAQSPTMIGHLSPRHAHKLVTVPMGALGFRFESDELIHRILGHCSYQPFLLQMFCDRLVRHMHDMRRTGIGAQEPPYTVVRADVEAVEGDPELREDIIETFRDTLHLDPRYNIIACVLAHHAYERGLDVRLSEGDLRGECLDYWREGFKGLDSDAFRAYLKEMVGLGLLADNRDLRGWRLRSANALRMMGTNEAVMTTLVNAEEEMIPAESITLAVRRQLEDDRLAPLTASQLDDLLGDHTNQVRLVLGSAATGIADVTETIRSVRDDFGGRFDLQEPQDRRRYEEALEQGRAGQRRIVLSDLARVTSRADTCLASVQAALERTPLGRGVTRSVVLVSGPAQMEFWETLLADPEHRGVGLVRLRRHDDLSLRNWSRTTELFTTTERQEFLLEITGGWPVLVDRAQELAGRYQEKKALERLAKELAQPARAAELVDQVGLTAHWPIAESFDAIVELLDGPATRADLVEAVALKEAHPDPDTAVECLDALGVFDRTEDDTYGVEPLLARCWRHREL